MGLLRVLSHPNIQIPISIVLSLTIGIILNKTTSLSPEIILLSSLPGSLWIRALKSIVIPLILVSMISSMQRLRTVKGGGRLTTIALFYFFGTTLLAVIEGILFSMLILFRTTFIIC
jgi:Na+/H+-dicarboxylate symporter